MPGLVNAHTHLPMTLLRGYADDYELKTWLTEHIFPAEERLDQDAFPRGLCWNRRGGSLGTTSVSDMYYFCEEIRRGRVRIRDKANIARGLTVFEPGFDFYKNSRLLRTEGAWGRWHGFDNGRIKVDASVHAGTLLSRVGDRWGTTRFQRA
jgi:5-methylthioadenosine/S-adenosylhomocysteine deaminase